MDYYTDLIDGLLITGGDFDIDPNQRNLKSDYPIDNSASPISISNYNAVGGSTILYLMHNPLSSLSFNLSKSILFNFIKYL